MDYVFLSIACAITGTILVLVICVYLYGVYREPYLGAWIVGWLIHFTRLALFESGLLDWKYPLLNSLIYQTLFILCVLMLLYSSYLLINKPLHRNWLYASALTLILSGVFDQMQLSEFWKIIPPAWLTCIMLVYIGDIFLHKIKGKGIGNFITGYAFILWGLFTAAAFIFADNLSFPKWILSTGIIRLVIASGIILVYFEKTRLDLVSKEAYFRELADNSIDIVYRYRIDPEKVEYISPSVYLITGYTPENFYTNPYLFESLIHPDDLLTFKTYINNPSWPTDVPFDYRLIRKDKSIVYVEQNFVSIYDQEGNVGARQGILRDVTARNNIDQIQSQYDELNLVGKMAVSLAHQIRNPLTTIRGYLQILKNKGMNKDKYSLMLEEIDNANSVISEYLLLAQDKRTYLKKCTLNAIIRSALSLIETYAATSNIVIKTELEDIPELLLDESEIRCMVMNLLRNSIDAMPSGGDLTLRTFVNKKEVVLSIGDQGHGIQEDILNRLGTPFLTTKSTGIGLGVPICYRIASRNHADIRISSGIKGTTIFIYFSMHRSVA